MTERTFTTPPCPHCHKTSEVELDPMDVLRWTGSPPEHTNGEPIQKVWPEMTSDERELLMTGTHPGCWNAMWEDAGESAVAFLQDIFKDD